MATNTNNVDYLVDLLVSNAKRTRKLASQLASPVADGKNGKNGTNGKSAYQYAVDGGFTGTEAQFITALNAEYSHETFTFELEDGTTVTKEILVYTGA